MLSPMSGVSMEASILLSPHRCKSLVSQCYMCLCYLLSVSSVQIYKIFCVSKNEGFINCDFKRGDPSSREEISKYFLYCSHNLFEPYSKLDQTISGCQKFTDCNSAQSHNFFQIINLLEQYTDLKFLDIRSIYAMWWNKNSKCYKLGVFLQNKVYLYLFTSTNNYSSFWLAELFLWW